SGATGNPRTKSSSTTAGQPVAIMLYLTDSRSPRTISPPLNGGIRHVRTCTPRRLTANDIGGHSGEQHPASIRQSLSGGPRYRLCQIHFCACHYRIGRHLSLPSRHVIKCYICPSQIPRQSCYTTG